LGADDLRPHLAWQTASADRHHIHFCWSTVALEHSIHGQWAMALAHRSLRPPALWEGPGEAVSPYIPNGPRKKDFCPRLTVGRDGRVHVIFIHERRISYICRSAEGWGPIEVIDAFREPEPTIQSRNLWSIIVDTTGRVCALYSTPAGAWKLRVRSPGARNGWRDGPPLPGGTYGYTGVATPDGGVHLLYGDEDNLWYNRLVLD
jgi:hypothetical protein